MKGFEKRLEEINNLKIEDLPDVKLSDSDKERAKNRLFKSIEDLKRRNRDMNINITDAEVLTIKSSLGEASDKYANGVEHGFILREVAIKAADKEVYEKYGEITHEVLATNAYATSNLGWMANGAIAYKLYLTDNKLVKYSFSEFYEVIDKKEYKIEDIKFIGSDEDGTYYIEFKNKVVTYIGFTTSEMMLGIDKLMSLLIEKGVAKKENKLITKDRVITAIYIITVIVFMSLFTLSKF
ncbi:MAG: hypothetical protein RR620_02805 [Clostridium sp.]